MIPATPGYNYVIKLTPTETMQTDEASIIQTVKTPRLCKCKKA